MQCICSLHSEVFPPEAHPSWLIFCWPKKTPGVWIEKDLRTIGTGVAWVFLIRGPTIQKRGAKTCSHWFLFFSNDAHPSCLVKNTTPHAVWIEKDRRTIGTGVGWVFLIRGPTIQKKGAKPCSYWFIFFSNETHTSCCSIILQIEF